MFENTLWIYTSIAGACLGAAFLMYIKDTTIGLWAYGKIDDTVDYFRDKYGGTLHPEFSKIINAEEVANN